MKQAVHILMLRQTNPCAKTRRVHHDHVPAPKMLLQEATSSQTRWDHPHSKGQLDVCNAGSSARYSLRNG